MAYPVEEANPSPTPLEVKLTSTEVTTTRAPVEDVTSTGGEASTSSGPSIVPLIDSSKSEDGSDVDLAPVITSKNKGKARAIE